MEGEEGQANSGWCGAWGRMEDSGKWRMKKVDKIEEENKKSGGKDGGEIEKKGKDEETLGDGHG